MTNIILSQYGNIKESARRSKHLLPPKNRFHHTRNQWVNEEIQDIQITRNKKHVLI
jgi:hypothetical protein